MNQAGLGNLVRGKAVFKVATATKTSNGGEAGGSGPDEDDGEYEQTE